LEFGIRIHLEDFSQTTAVVLSLYLPLAVLALSLHPPVRALMNPAGGAVSLISQMLFAQLLLRLVQVFVFVLLILRLEAHRNQEGNVWDLAEALSQLGRVARVDLAYAFGLQILAILIFWLSLTVASLLFGEGPLSLPFAFSLTAFLVIAPAVRFYFCSLAALLHGDGFAASFRRAGEVSAGGERQIVLLVLLYLLVWFAVWQIVHGFFGAGLFGQLILQAAIMVTSISYFFAGYRLYFDLVPAVIRRELEARPLSRADAEDHEDRGAG